MWDCRPPWGLGRPPAGGAAAGRRNHSGGSPLGGGVERIFDARAEHSDRICLAGGEHTSLAEPAGCFNERMAGSIIEEPTAILNERVAEPDGGKRIVLTGPLAA